MAQNPHILVTNGDKQDVLQKIQQQVWAKSIYAEMQKTVNTYVDRHQTDPQWILSRYLMNRVPGNGTPNFLLISLDKDWLDMTAMFLLLSQFIVRGLEAANFPVG